MFSSLLKKKVLIPACVLGVSASIFAMSLTPNKSSAAVAVWDSQNIAKAIEILKQNINIFNTDSSIFDLTKINTQSMPEGTKAAWNIIMDKIHKDRTAEQDKYVGVLNRSKSYTDYFDRVVGTVEGVFNGSEDPRELYYRYDEYLKLRDQLNKDALESAKRTTERSEERQQQAETINQSIGQAKGQKEVQQGLAFMQSLQLDEIHDTNTLLAHILSSIAATNHYNEVNSAQSYKNMQETTRYNNQIVEKAANPSNYYTYKSAFMPDGKY